MNTRTRRHQPADDCESIQEAGGLVRDGFRRNVASQGVDVIAEDSKEHLRSCMERDLNAILVCDALVMLHGWEHSEGARVEHSLATYLGMPIFYES